jgi:tetratricopeptide (TPR) repeat protein
MIKATIAILIVLILTGCQSEADERSEQVQTEWAKYKTAIDMDDYYTAISVVHNIIVLDSNNYQYYDTLAKLYYLTKEYKSALASAEKSMKHKLNEQTVGIAYNCVKGSDETDKIMEYGEILLTFKTDSIGLLYDMAFQKTKAFDYEMAKNYLNQIILDPASLSTTYNEFRGNGVQEVPYRAAAYNLLGFIHNEAGEMQIAKDMFKSALSYKEDYVLAQENLLIVDSLLTNN